MERKSDRARVLATGAHAGRSDKAGRPYMEHVERVADAVAHLGDDYESVALLHDVVEDTEIRLVDLASESYSQSVVEAVDAITRRPSEIYAEYIGRVSLNSIAATVKYADLVDNTDARRDGYAALKNSNPSLLARYEKAKARLSPEGQ